MAHVNRTDRLHAISEELRRVGRAGTTGARLARVLEVSERTIKRDIDALQQAGAPIWAQAGPGGGYVLDASASLPPVNFTPAQAVAVAVALATLPPGSPFAVDGVAARGKVWDALGPGDRERAARLSARVWTRPTRAGFPARTAPPTGERGAVDDDAASGGPAAPAVLRAVEQSLADGRVLTITYRTECDATRRSVEPILLAHTEGRWYLVGWCRLREAVRWFRIDRIEHAHLTTERATPRDVATVGTPPDDAAPVA
jgi:predicted DNA-binding transcriptional regulator YafY